MGVLDFPRLTGASRWLIALCALAAIGIAGAQPAATPVPSAKGAERTVNEWLVRMHEASRMRSYVGTFVVSSNAGAMSSARIWHACDADQKLERVETLTGAPRSTFRRNDEVMVFLPESRVVKVEKRESAGLFPDLLQSRETSLPEFYSARRIGQDRVAGYDADVVLLAPKDGLRFGYRIWSEKKSGLVVKLQTLDTEGNVLEQSAFSELQLDAPVRIEKLAQMMATPEGWRVEKAETLKTNALSEGWGLKSSIPGFQPMGCYKRPTRVGTPTEGTMQWIFSDGLASVSLFVEAYDRQRHGQEGLFAAGATHSFTRRIQDWWLTVVGEVPPLTLRAFAQNLERRK
jgi:sigma-E factor negative regulatory protein RseB